MPVKDVMAVSPFYAKGTWETPSVPQGSIHRNVRWIACNAHRPQLTHLRQLDNGITRKVATSGGFFPILSWILIQRLAQMLRESLNRSKCKSYRALSAAIALS
jgi:hypothetical protein